MARKTASYASEGLPLLRWPGMRLRESAKGCGLDLTYLPSRFVKMVRWWYNRCVGEIGPWFSFLVVVFSSLALGLAVGSGARPWLAYSPTQLSALSAH